MACDDVTELIAKIIWFSWDIYISIYIYILGYLFFLYLYIYIYIDILIYYSYRYRMTGYVGMYNQPTQNVVQRRACRNMQLEYTLASVFFMTWWMVPWRICPSFSLVIPNCCCLLLAFQDPDYSCIVEKHAVSTCIYYGIAWIIHFTVESNMAMIFSMISPFFHSTNSVG